MTEPLSPELLKINEFIRHVAAKKEPIFESYKYVYKNHPDLKIDFVDFEWRYYQFLHGNRYLTIKKSPENSSPVAFSDLPMDVLEKVVEKSALLDRLALRKVSHGLRTLVDSTEVHCEKIGFYFTSDFATITFENNDELCYEQNYKEPRIPISEFQLPFSNASYEKNLDKGCRISLSGRKELKDDRHFQQAMTVDALTILKNRKLKIERFEHWGTWDKTCLEFMAALTSLNVQLNVRSFDYCSDSTYNAVLPVLQVLKPTILEKIEFSVKSLYPEDLNAIADTEQWKRAKKLDWFGIPNGFQMEKLHHFKEIKIFMYYITDENLAMVRDVLLKSAHLEFLQLIFKDWDQNEEEIELNIERIMSQNPAYNSENRRFWIPNSLDYFQLEVGRHVLSFTRVFHR